MYGVRAMSRIALEGPLVELIQLDEHHTASVRTTIERPRLRRTISVLHELVMDAVGEQGLAPAGPLFTRYHSLSSLITLECGMPLAQPITPAGIVVPSFLPGGPVLHGRHLGDHAGLPAAYKALEEDCTRRGRDPMGGPWECYIVDGRDSPDTNEWVTDVYLPVRALVPIDKRRPCGMTRSGLTALPIEQAVR